MSDQGWPRLRQTMRFWRRGDNTGAAAPLENEEAEAPMLLPGRSDWRWLHFPQAFRFWRPAGANEGAPPLRNEEGEPPLEEQPLEARIVNGVLHPPAWLAEQYQEREVTIPQLVLKRLEELSDHTVAAIGNVPFSGADVLKMIKKYATMFQDRGVGPGVRVWALLSNSLENLAASLAVIFLGGVLYLTGYAQTDDDMVKRLVDSAATFILTEKKSVARVRSLLATRLQDRAQWYKDLVLGPDAGMIDPFALPDDAIFFREHIPVSSAEIAVVLHTSGYSASQKMVEITHKAYACAFESYRVLNHIDPTDVFLAWTPLCHVFGFSLNAFSMLLGALTVFEEPTIDYEELTALVIRHNVTATFCFPERILAIIGAAHDKPIDELDIHKPHAFPPLKKIMIGGDVIPGSLPKLLLKNFHYQILHRYYGLTEAFGLVIVSGVGEKTGAFDGIPAPGCQIKIMPPENDYEPYAEDCDGEICVKSDRLGLGYYHVPPFSRLQTTVSFHGPDEGDETVPKSAYLPTQGAGVPHQNTQAPPQGTQAPPQGTQAPPQGTQAPPQGTQAPPQGTQAPPQGTQAPPQGAQAPPQGAQAPPQGAQAPPQGAQAPPQGAQAPPQGAQAPPQGAQAPPQGAQAPPQGAQAPPQGAQAPPQGAQAPPQGAQAPPQGAQAPPQGTQAPPQGTQAPPQGTQAPPQGANAPPTGAYSQSTGANAPPTGAYSQSTGACWDAPSSSKATDPRFAGRAPEAFFVPRQLSSESESTSSIDFRRSSRRPSDAFFQSDALTSSDAPTPSDFPTSNDPTPSDFPNSSDLPTPSDERPTSRGFGPSGEPDEPSVTSIPDEAWLRTGDLGRYDGQGRITILGRIMDRISFAGVTLMPHQLEDTLREMKFAKEVCVVPIPCNVTPTAAVILKKSWRKDEAKAAKLIHHLLRSEELSPLTGGIIFCESLPKSEDCRVLRHQLRRIQLPGLPAPP